MCGCWWLCKQWLSESVNHDGRERPSQRGGGGGGGRGEDGWNSEEGCGMALTWPLALHLGFISARVEVQQLRGALIFHRGPFALHPARANGKQRCKNLQAYHVASVHAVGGLCFGKEYAVAAQKQNRGVDPQICSEGVLWMPITRKQKKFISPPTSNESVF